MWMLEKAESFQMAGMATFIWYTIVIVGILVSSLAMISVGAACWDYCDTVPVIARYLVISGSTFFCLLVLLLLFSFCVCTSSGDLRIRGALKIVLSVSLTAMYGLVLAGSTLLFLYSPEDVCNRTSSRKEDLSGDQLITTAPRTVDFCTTSLPIFSHSVLMVFHLLFFFSLLLAFNDDSK